MLWMSETSLKINGIEITFREILASAVIVLVMLILGTVISGHIKQAAMECKQEYSTAIDISSEDRFGYGLRTDVGRAFCYGTLSAVDTVSEDEIGGPYMYIYREEQHYNMHTRVVTHTDGRATPILPQKSTTHGIMLALTHGILRWCIFWARILTTKK